MELFSHEQRGERGKILAQEHHGPKEGGHAGETLLKRLDDNEKTLREIHRVFIDDVTAKLPVAAVARWLVDNFYVIAEQITLAKRHLPRKYLLELPSIDNRGREGLPRVYDIAEHIIAYGDSRVDVEDVSVVVSAYQEVAPLKLGELWAMPIMLRLALIENIRRMAEEELRNRRDREAARKWSENLINIEENDPKNLILAIADMARAKPSLSGAFVAEFKRRLWGRGNGMLLPLQWLEQNLQEQGRSVDATVSDENHGQAVSEISMRNCVTSLRNLNVTDWSEFVESLSLVERVLRKDPSDVYGRMDFKTRDSYRRVVEELAAKSGRDEIVVATECLDLARDAALIRGAGAREAHVGYYLVDEGERVLHRAIRYGGGLSFFLRSASTNFTLFLYLGAIAGLTVALTALTAALARAGGVHGDRLLLLTLLLAFATCQLSVWLVNYAASLIVKPRLMPRMNFRDGIPAECRTMVAVPLMITSEKGIHQMLRNIENAYLNNRGRNVHFCLLTDYADADSETMPDDERLLNLSRLGVMKLNDKYREDGGDNFFLFHRPRVWNPTERKWMGWERKRGKLENLNRYLVGTDLDAFSHIEGGTHALSNVRYVITLDADTIMARDSAWKMVGAMAHPLNRPVYDVKRGRVVSGHGILQPRVCATLTGANETRYARMSASEVGIDPYTRASSDVYQDLFDEGSFIGKGIYDVAVFEEALGRRFPENKILSHDLLEGCVLRCGLLNDVKLYEDPPRGYLMDAARQHRWIRGDWQIASFLLAREVRDGKATETKPLNLLSQWKVADNLRRSLTPIVLFFILVLALSVMTRPALYLLVVGGVFLAPVVVAGLGSLVRKNPDKTLGQHLRTSFADTLNQAGQMFFSFACLPFRAAVAADAILRSLWRQCVSHRNLLQWNPFDNSHQAGQVRLGAVYRRMWICPVVAVIMAAVVSVKNPGLLKYAAPLLLLWFLAPALASWLSRTRKPHEEVVDEPARRFLRSCARRTWLFFETFVNEDENWLPPDNFQEDPGPVIAHRTSPTNMGLSLLANLSAHDFGYVTGGRLLRRCEKALETMARMERHNGHFYNWYDTLTLDVLRPAYVSTVDSGNLATHLLVLAQGLREVAAAPVIGGQIGEGLADTLDLAMVEADAETRARLETLRRQLGERPASAATAVAERRSFFVGLLRETEAAIEAAKTPDSTERCSGWLEAFLRQVRDCVEEMDELMPWAAVLEKHPEWAEHKDLAAMPTLVGLVELWHRLELGETGEESEKRASGAVAMPEALRSLVALGGEQAANRLATLQKLLVQCEDMANVDFCFLYDSAKRLLSIGFNVDDHRLDASFYDLLASEARLSAYLAVAQDKLPQSSWFSLGRLLTRSGGRPLLVSWSGSMFEYLMPLLVMPAYEETLLDETCRACVAVQAEYARGRNVPWGISESGYYLFDSERNYQYRAFGVPELGLKYDLAEDLVIAPYASVLAAMVAPETAAKNMRRMAESGLLTRFGFYEAVDYTPSRLPHGEEHAVVRSFMAHHQGMSMVALGQALLGRPMHRRFSANPVLQSAEMLLQETAPAERAIYYHPTYSPELRQETTVEDEPVRRVRNPGAPHPEVQLLSNGNYHVMITAAGGGYSRWRDVSLTRWREDAVRDNWGSFCYLRDRATGEVFSNTCQPMGGPSHAFEAAFSEGKAEFSRRDEEIDCHTEIVVSPEDDVEVRRIRIGNRSGQDRVFDLVSYAEVALNFKAADDSHQAFSKLFVESRIVEERQALVFSRRARSEHEERFPLLFHMLAVRGVRGGGVSYETDRLRFLGRANDASSPAAVAAGLPLSGTVGAVLDPVAAIGTDVTVPPGGVVVVDLVTGVAPDEEALCALLEKYQDERTADKAMDLAYTHGQLLLRQLNITDTEAQRYAQLAGAVIYNNRSLRADASILMRNRKGQPDLWGYAISGDLPLVLLRIGDPSRIQFVSQMIQAHAYWRQKGLKVDLMIWNEDQTGYRQTLHDMIVGLAAAVMDDAAIEKPGGIFVRPGERIPEEDRTLIQTVARVVLSDEDGMLDKQLRRLAKSEAASTSTAVRRRRGVSLPPESGPVPVEDLVMDNGYGGFSRDGREYVVITDAGRNSPLPWVNVIANENFGCIVSEAGAGCTWGSNAQEFRLTPWSNDPVSDPAGEAIYIRDEETGDFWSPTPSPSGKNLRYVARHGFGYSVFLHNERGIESRLTVHVDRKEAVKFCTLRLVNHSPEWRNLSVTGYVEWVLGDRRDKTGPHIVTGVDSFTGALFARNQYSEEFRDAVAFLDLDDPGRGVSGDRREFVGRNGSLENPAAMLRPRLSGRVGPGMDSCGAVQTRFNLGPGREREVVIRLGVAPNVEEARRMVKSFRGLEAARVSLRQVRDFWTRTLGFIQVDTPDLAFNFMVNGWLLYQTLSCRFWGRAATYQSGGAFGFRDQLQDSLALAYAAPQLMREHLLRSASRQFVEGDVQHWWHPPLGRGVRTRCSDDYLWLPYVTERYVAVTGDTGVLDERIRFITGRALREDEESYYDLPDVTQEEATLYEHCRRSILHGLRFGEHGLPLMGSGDWNDGMDQVGIKGRGESVWLGFFLHSVLTSFAGLAEKRDDAAFADECLAQARTLGENLEAHGWDGEWYRRAYFDDGTPLGSKTNGECRIDSIAQSWSVLSGVGSAERTAMAMRSLDTYLVDREHLVIKLFTPPFDKTPLNPGYIKGYVPGVRENGGQYTHGAIWAAMAYAKLGDGNKAWEMQTLLNPASHGATREVAEMYMDEPYVVAADVYANPQHTGRGGWSWYTGSSSWLYRFMLESILGFSQTADTVRLNPCVPDSWDAFSINLLRGDTKYSIHVTRNGNGHQATGAEQTALSAEDAARVIRLEDDHADHRVEVEL